MHELTDYRGDFATSRSSQGGSDKISVYNYNGLEPGHWSANCCLEDIVFVETASEVSTGDLQTRMARSSLQVLLNKLSPALRSAPGVRERFMASFSSPLFEKVDPGHDAQEDSSANAEALEESQRVADQFQEIQSSTEHEEKGESKRDPEVKDKTGKSFPHQTDEQRTQELATNTEGESQVKTREYTPKEKTNVYDDK